MIPYIHINHGGSNLSHFSQWTFPILRAVGGFLTASTIPLVLQRRISRLAATRLIELNTSATPGNPRSPGDVVSNQSHPIVDGIRTEQGADDTEPLRSTAQHVSHDSRTGDIEKALGITAAPSNTLPADSASDGKPMTARNDMAESPYSLPRHISSAPHGALDWVFLGLLLAGILSSVVGYVGCFSVVQNAKLRTGPLSWLCLEAGLSAIRMILWGLNPKGDDAPPLELVLRLDHDTILPTCNHENLDILQGKVLPLTRANQFLKMITSFAGLVERFTHPDLTIYYTLTRKPRVISDYPDEAGKRVLYITLFDHKERTTRVYTRDGMTERFYSTESDVPLIDLRHDLLNTILDKEIISTDDLIAGDPEIGFQLRRHYQSIMDQIHFTLGETSIASASTSPSPPPAYAIENRWTLRTADTMGARERTRLEEQTKNSHGTWVSTVERGRTTEVDGSQPSFERDRLYFQHSQFESMRQSHDAARGRWIDTYMGLVTREQTNRLKGDTTAMRRVNGEPAENETVLGKDPFDSLNALIGHGLVNEIFFMEQLLVHEVEAWEGLVWTWVKEFMGRNDVPESEKERLTREWRGNCWRRLDSNIRAMDTRTERMKAKFSALPMLLPRLEYVQDDIRRAWQSVIQRLVDTPTPLPSSTPWSYFSQDLQQHAEQSEVDWDMSPPAQQEQMRIWYKGMARRLNAELADVEFRVAQGSDQRDCLYAFEALTDYKLLDCRHSQSKSVFLHGDYLGASLDFYSRAFKGNNDLVHIAFDSNFEQRHAWFAETISDLRSVTSIRVPDRHLLPPIQRDTPLFIDDYDDPQSLETFLINDQSLAGTRDTHVFMQCANGWANIAVSFVGPSFGNLILRLKHRANEPDVTLTILGTAFTLTIPESHIIDDINLHPIGESSSQLSFLPNIRNNLILQISSPVEVYILQDVQLLDEDENPYHGQPSRRNIPAIEFDALSTPDDRESRDSESQQESAMSQHEDIPAD
jgi:hypothetical protein